MINFSSTLLAQFLIPSTELKAYGRSSLWNPNPAPFLVQHNFFLWFVAFSCLRACFAHVLSLIPSPGFDPWFSFPVLPSCIFTLLPRSCKTVCYFILLFYYFFVFNVLFYGCFPYPVFASQTPGLGSAFYLYLNFAGFVIFSFFLIKSLSWYVRCNWMVFR